MTIKIIKDHISQEELQRVAAETFVTMVKAVVDVGQGMVALGGELHADGEAELLKVGSKQEDLWGINIYPNQLKDDRIEYVSLINIRPTLGSNSMEVEDQNIRDRIKEIVDKLFE